MTNESFIKVNDKLVLVNGHPITINDIDNGSSSNLQENKTIVITSNGTIEVTPDTEYDAMTKVTVTTNVVSGGGSDAGGVSFIDYDGTVVEIWALSDLTNKTELPTPPAHDRLVFQQWNWTLEDIKAANAEMTVGALYTTASGLTEFHIRATKASGLAITCNMVGNKNWGDGTEDALTSHTYADYGDYIITCDGDTITENEIGETTKIRDMLLCVSISNNVTSIRQSAFENCHALQSVSFSNSITSIGNYAFSYCYALQSISISNSVISIENYAFKSCYALQSISIPNSVTSIGQSAFENCHALQSISISNSVTSIGDYAFGTCYASEYDFSQFSKVPILGANAFQYILSSAKILVPSALYDTWVAATDWSTYANYIVGVQLKKKE